MTTIDVTATRWDRGWELAIDGDPVTQIRTLDRAEQQVRDYLDTLDPAVDHSDVSVNLVPNLGDGVSVHVKEAREATAAAKEHQLAAARQPARSAGASRARGERDRRRSPSGRQPWPHQSARQRKPRSCRLVTHDGGPTRTGTARKRGRRRAPNP